MSYHNEKLQKINTIENLVESIIKSKASHDDLNLVLNRAENMYLLKSSFNVFLQKLNETQLADSTLSETKNKEMDEFKNEFHKHKKEHK